MDQQTINPATEADPQNGVSTPPQNPAKAFTSNEDRHALLKARLSVAKAFCKKPHASMKRWVKEYGIDDVGDLDEVRDKIRIGYIFRKVESDLPAIFDDQPEIFIKGRKAGLDTEIKGVIESTYDWLWDTQHLEEKIEDVGLYFVLLGMGFISSPYVTKTKTVLDQQTGQPMQVPTIDQPMAEVEDPFKIYFSPETKFSAMLDYEHCPYYFKKRVMTVDEVKARFGKEVEANESLKLEDVDAQDEIEREAAGQEDDLKRVTVYEYYGCLPEDFKVEGSEWSYDADYHLFLTDKEELSAEACPYPSKPLFVVGNYGLANQFWKFGDAKHLMPLVQELQQYRSQILEHTRKMANPKPLIPTTANIDAKAFRDPRPGRPVTYDPSGGAPTYLSPANLGREVEVGIEQARTDLEKESGSFDLASGGNQSTVKTPRGIQVYTEAADKNVARKRKKIARLIRELVIFQFQLLAQYWKPEDNKTLMVMDQDVQVDAQILSLLGGVNIYYNLDIETESLSVNHTQVKQDALDLFDLASKFPYIFSLDELAKYVLQSGYRMRDGDRFLANDQQKQQYMDMMRINRSTIRVNVMADATTPPGAQVLESEGILQPGQGEQAVIDNQVMQHVSGQAQGKQQLQEQTATAQLTHQHQQEQQFTQAALKGPQQPKQGGGFPNGK